MNKQELIERIECLKNLFGNKSEYVEIDTVIRLISELDEPQEVKVPKFVADYIKYAIENDWDFQDLFKCIEDEEDEELLRWVYHERNQETLAAAWINGYTVEKEKRYLVKMKGLTSNYSVLKYQSHNNSWFMGSEQEYDFFKFKHTKEELEKAGFGEVFNSPLFEIEEVD